MFRRVITLCVIIILPLVPAVLLYLLFGTEGMEALVKIKGINLGGPIAAYFIILITALKFFPKLQPQEVETLVKQSNRNAINQHKTEGHWIFEANFSDENGQAQEVGGKACVRLNSDGDLHINGDWLDENDKSIGAWEADEIILKEDKITYIYYVPPIGKYPASTGVGTLHFETTPTNDAVDRMHGHWGVLGQNINGAVTWERISSNCAPNI